VRAVAVQTGAVGNNRDENLRSAEQLVRSAPHGSDLIVLPELFALPFWCVGLSDQRFFDWAEDLEGPTVSTMRKVARESQAYLVVPFFEKGDIEGEYYNSAVVVDPAGAIVSGKLPSGRGVQSYRKNAVSSYRWEEQVNDEKFYFRPGEGFPVFDTAIGRIGILICYDRWYPEAWRVLALQGAEIICVANASAGAVSDMFVPLIRTSAAQNLVFAIATNRAGEEEFEGKRTSYYGLSCIVDPVGNVLAQADGACPDQLPSASLDMARISRERTRYTMFRDRRPEIYGVITDGSREVSGDS
jgi:N-carbamoylputrescine amidase